MSRHRAVFIAFIVLALAIAAAACGSGGNRASLVSSFRAKAEQAADQSKAQVVKAVVQAFTMENGRPPESLQELVDKGYIRPEGIVDSRGNELPYSPAGYAEETTVSKSCGSCGKPVAVSSQVGDRCPHCGVPGDGQKGCSWFSLPAAGRSRSAEQARYPFKDISRTIQPHKWYFFAHQAPRDIAERLTGSRIWIGRALVASDQYVFVFGDNADQVNG